MIGGYAVAFHAEPRFTKDLDVWTEPGDQSVTVIGRAELIRNKRASGRPQDLLDLQILERV